MEGPNRLRLVIIMILVGAIVAATLAVPLWIDQITGQTRPEVVSDEPFYTPTTKSDDVALANIPATSTPTNTPLPAEADEKNCVRDLSYWQSHQESWPFEEIRIADQSFSKAEAIAIVEAETQEPTPLIQQQLIVYTLNIQYGADQSAVLDTVIDAYEWLNSHPAGSALSEGARQQAYELVNMLNEFNLGNLSPGRCPPMTDTPVPTPTSTPTQTASPTASPTATATYTPVVELPDIVLTPLPIVRPKPDSTKDPADRDPTEPAPPEPTEAPPEPTEPPPPPPTEPPPPPPPTAAPTEVELPTAAPTPES